MVSGLQAAIGVWNAHPLGNPIEIKTSALLPAPLFAAMKAWMAPWAYAAKCWSDAGESSAALAVGDADAAQAALTTRRWISTPLRFSWLRTCGRAWSAPRLASERALRPATD